MKSSYSNARMHLVGSATDGITTTSNAWMHLVESATDGITYDASFILPIHDQVIFCVYELNKNQIFQVKIIAFSTREGHFSNKIAIAGQFYWLFVCFDKLTASQNHSKPKGSRPSSRS